MVDTSVHNIASKQEFDQLTSEKGVFVLDAFATWCGPCKVIAPILVEMSKQFEAAKFYKFDVDEVPDLAQELQITAMPTILVFKDGAVAEKIVGANPPAIQAAIAKSL